MVTDPPSQALTLENIKDLLTIAALFVGGYWTHKLYRQKRQRFPQLNVSHKIKHWRLADNRLLIRVTVIFTNAGETLLELADGYVRLLQMRPLPLAIVTAVEEGKDPVEAKQTEIDWPRLAIRYMQRKKFEVEPKETDEAIFEFIIPGGLQTIIVESAFENRAKRRERPKFWKSANVCWNKTTVYELGNQPERRSLMSRKPTNDESWVDKQGPAREDTRPQPDSTFDRQGPSRESVRPEPSGGQSSEQTSDQSD